VQEVLQNGGVGVKKGLIVAESIPQWRIIDPGPTLIDDNK
jgi:hypothetical protein